MTKQPTADEIYKRTTCQRCKKEISRQRVLSCKKRRFWPVCVECEKWLIPKYKEAMKKLKEKGMSLK